jgi:hypothetical protein
MTKNRSLPPDDGDQKADGWNYKILDPSGL